MKMIIVGNPPIIGTTTITPSEQIIIMEQNDSYNTYTYRYKDVGMLNEIAFCIAKCNDEFIIQVNNFIKFVRRSGYARRWQLYIYGNYY